MREIATVSEAVSPRNPPARERVGLAATVGSVLAAFFGVQSSRARTRDFSSGSPKLFVLVAIGLTATFALSLLTIVHLVVSRVASAG